MINDNNESTKYFITVRSKNHDILPLVATWINPGESINKVAKEMRKSATRAACFKGQDINPASLQWGVYTCRIAKNDEYFFDGVRIYEIDMD